MKIKSAISLNSELNLNCINYVIENIILTISRILKQLSITDHPVQHHENHKKLEMFETSENSKPASSSMAVTSSRLFLCFSSFQFVLHQSWLSAYIVRI